jgi:hexosaminidase
MAMVKMNVFHWHISDSHSFPIYLKSHPEITKYGAYSDAQIYSEKDIKDIVQFARIRGVRIVPEFDSPGKNNKRNYLIKNSYPF